MKKWAVAGAFIVSPRARTPEPASKMIRSSPARISRHAVLPPKRAVAGPGEGVDPRTPQKRTKKSAAGEPSTARRREPDLGVRAWRGDLLPDARFRVVLREELNQVPRSLSL